MAQNDANTTEEPSNESILAALAGEGRTEVDRISPPEQVANVRLDTPEGEVVLTGTPDGSSKEGRDRSMYWNRHGYEVEFSIDTSPGADTHSVVVMETDR